MLKYFLNPEIYVCTMREQAVALDLRSGRYFGIDCRNALSLIPALAGAQASATGELHLSEMSVTECAEALENLSSRGILTSDPATLLRPRQFLSPASASLVSTPREVDQRIRLLTIVQVILSFVVTRLLLRLFGLRAIVRRFQHMSVDGLTNQSATEKDIELAEELTRQFVKIRPWIYTAHGRCLFDAVTLTDFLRRNRLPAKLVIGTFPMPFSAHAWVQLGDYLVDDTVEAVKMYVPILSA